jgi:alkylation response protein AidB-like acyl-CoA dehydrogenase
MVAVEAPVRLGVPSFGALDARPRVLLPEADHMAFVERLAPGVAARDGAAPGQPVGRDAVADLSAWIDARFTANGGYPDHSAADLTVIGQALASAAWTDLSVGFPLWCHRMVVEYLAAICVKRPRATRGLLAAVRRGDLLGSTALAPAISHVVAGTSLPVTWREEHGGDIVLDGQLRWASNLFPPNCLLVTAAVHASGRRPILVAIPGDTPGLHIDSYPEILALGATGSSSVRLNDVRVSGEYVLTCDLRAFVTSMRAPFLLLQSCFALGLARRALDEAEAALNATTSPVARTFVPDHDALEESYARAADAVICHLRVRGARVPIRDIVALRLDCARLASEAVALEAKVVGGRSYLASSGTARRLREAAFLPVQAPTEGQLRWELSLSA